MSVVALLAALASAEPLPPDACAAHFTEEGIGERDGPACVYKVARTQGLYAEGEAFLADVVREHPEWGHARMTLGSLRMDTGDYDAALEDYRAALELFDSSGEVQGAVFTRLNLTQLTGRLGMVDEMRTHLADAIDVAKEAGDDGLMRTVQSQRLRTAWRHRLDLDLTLARAIELHEALSETDNYQTRLIALHVAVKIAAELERHEVWLTYYPKLVALLQANEDRYAESNTRASALRYLAGQPSLAPRVLGETTIAEEALEVADLARDGGNPWTEVEVLFRAAALLPLGEAMPLVERARAVGAELEEAAYLPGLDLQWAMAIAHRHPEVALAVVDRYSDALVSDTYLATASKARFDAYHALGNLEARDKAGRAYRTEARRVLDAGVDAGRSSRSAWDADHHDLAWVAAEEGDLAEAHAILESIRAQAVRSALDRADAPTAMIGDEDLREAFRAAREAVEQAEEGVEFAAEDGLADAQAALDDAREQMARIHDEIRDKAPAYAALRRSEATPLAEIQAALGPDTVLVTFQVPVERPGMAEPWAMAVRADSITRYPLPATEALARKVSLFAGMHGEGTDVAKALYDELLGPAVSATDTRIVIVPEGPLYGMPFAALRPRLDGPPLGARLELVLAPSATLWSRWSTDHPDEGSVRAVADPAFAEDIALAHLATAPPRLSRAAEEAAALAPLAAEIRTGAEATESDWLPAHPRLLHFAAHAVIPPHDPGAAGLLLAPSEDADGWLSAEEILGSDVDGAVVVLSACQSAGGGAVGAQGPEGLASAFQQAGASAVIATLWPLRDDHAETFFAAFYDAVGAGASLGEAVRTAQASMAAAGHSHEAWAGVVLIGNPDVVLLSGGRSDALGMRWVGFGGAGLLVLGGLGLVIRERSRA